MTQNISQNNKFLLSGSWDKEIKIWSLNKGKVIRTYIGHTMSIRSISITQDIKYIVSGSEDKTIKIWNISSGIVKNTLIGHMNYVIST